MKKKGWSVLIGICIFFFAIFIFLWNAMPTWISHSLSQKAGVDVSISHFSLTPWSMGAYQFKMRNPPKSILPNALKIDSVKVDAPLTRMLHQNIVLDEMKITDLYLGLEFEAPTKPKGNWTIIMNNIRQSNINDATEETTSKKTVLIKKLIVKNTNVDLVFKQGNQQVKHLKPIPLMTFENVSSEGGLPTSQITNLVMSEILKEVFSQQNLMNMLKDVIQPKGGLPSSPLSPLKSLFSKSDLLEISNEN